MSPLRDIAGVIPAAQSTTAFHRNRHRCSMHRRPQLQHYATNKCFMPPPPQRGSFFSFFSKAATTFLRSPIRALPAHQGSTWQASPGNHSGPSGPHGSEGSRHIPLDVTV